MESAANRIPEEHFSFLKRFGWPIVFALIACYIGYKRFTAPPARPPSKSTSDPSAAPSSPSSAAATAAAEARVAAAAPRPGAAGARTPSVLDRLERHRVLAAVISGDYSGVPDRNGTARSSSGSAASGGNSNSRPAGVSAGLIAEQDVEYARAAAADMDRVAAVEAAAEAAEAASTARAVAAAEAAAAAAKADAIAARAAELARARAEATAARLAALGPEPAVGEAGCVLVGLRLPGGQRIQRRFRASGEVGGVRAWARAAADKDAEARAGSGSPGVGAGGVFEKRKALRLRDPLSKAELFCMRDGSKLISEAMGGKLQQLLVLDDDDDDAEDDEDDVELPPGLLGAGAQGLEGSAATTAAGSD